MPKPNHPLGPNRCSHKNFRGRRRRRGKMLWITMAGVGFFVSSFLLWRKQEKKRIAKLDQEMEMWMTDISRSKDEEEAVWRRIQ